MTTQCCICKRVREEQGAWKPATPEETATVSHTYCPVCLHESIIRINAEFAQANRPTAACA